MTLRPRAKGIIAALMASLAMAATPAHALELPRPMGSAPIAVDMGTGDAAHYRRYRHRNNGVDTGDIIAGILVLGGIAAIASAAGRDDDRPYRERANVPDRERGREADRSFESRGISRAVDMCMEEIERGRDRVASVDEAVRNAQGWYVSGALESGHAFTCRIGNDGRIDQVDVAGRTDVANSSGGEDRSYVDDRQYDDAVYARLRATQAGAPQPGLRDDRSAVVSSRSGDDAGGQRPAYPGGPFPGEQGYDDYVSGGQQPNLSSYQVAR